ncbi:asparagine synthetase B family protein [Paenibacillus xanthanilyticus]|uniref:asparagine synthase (glutamine-hydrolyzing) n=1 Tax=Paenibacillus xanthanilyticus TaxID=1783531 RepID=A0ABV8JWN3_9BACL
MSAIAGIVQHSGLSPDDRQLERMMQALERYPADDRRIWRAEHAAFGCHAQWITPESRGERLPYSCERTGLAITADAILDNREELFDRLRIARGLRAGMTDSELILCAYEAWDVEAARYLIGDYAFAIWDAKRGRLFGARDLQGNRTLYYSADEQRFAFCTVVGPLLALPGIQSEVEESWLAEFLAIPVILDTVDVHATAYRGIRQIPPGHSFSLTGGRLTLRQHDAIAIPQQPLKLKSDGDYVEAFRHVFREAVQARLRTIGEVGASLSGGLDSGAVASFAAESLRGQGRTLHTFSSVPPADFVDWTLKSMAADETPFIQAAVRHIGNLTNRRLDFAGRSPLDEVDDLIGLMEAPYKFFENSIWIKGMLEEASRQGIGVLLNGAAGNFTISWGPAPDYYARLLRRLQWRRLHAELKAYGRYNGVGRKKLLPYIAGLAWRQGRQAAGRRSEEERPSLIHPELARRTNVLEKLQDHDVGLSEWSELASRAYQFENLAAANHQGTSATKLSLQYGVAERDPTADPRVIRFCLSLPMEQFVKDGMDRALVRRAAAGMLPDEIRLNQRVRGVQGADWIHRMRFSWPALTDEVRQLCADPAAAGYLNTDQIRRSLQKLGPAPRAEAAFDPDARIVMQSLIVYRFLRRLSGPKA